MLLVWILIGAAGVSVPIWLIHDYLSEKQQEQPEKRGKKEPETTARLAIREPGPRPTGVRGEPYSAVMESSGGTAPVSWSIARGSLPAGLKLSSSGRIDGTPTKDGSFDFVARASDREGHRAEREFAITITAPEVVPPGAPLTIADSLEPTIVQRGKRYSTNLRATGGTPPVLWSLSRGALPRGLAMEPSSGRIEGMPLADGHYPFTVKVTDRARHTAQRAFAITVRPPEERPPATPPPTISVSPEPPAGVRGERYGTVLRASGGSGTLVWSVSQGALPRGVILDHAGKLEGTPADEGTARFTARVTDREGHYAERAFSIVVQAPKKPGCVARPFVLSQYGDSPSGTLTWSGGFATGADVRISGRRATTGSTRGDGLPASGVPVRINVEPGSVRKKEEPSAANCWISDLVLQNDGPAVSSITIKWVVFQP
jgi:hypothetical protein